MTSGKQAARQADEEAHMFPDYLIDTIYPAGAAAGWILKRIRRGADGVIVDERAFNIDDREGMDAMDGWARGMIGDWMHTPRYRAPQIDGGWSVGATVVRDWDEWPSERMVSLWRRDS